MDEAYDLLVIGGGINGAGIARDAAGRGLSVLLAEKGDPGAGTSSRSSKMIHGGLRYLEYYEFRLVRESLIEREVLLRAAPHIVWPMRFVLPHSAEQRPVWMVRLGLFLYDNLGGREKLPGTRRLDLRTAPEGRPVKDGFRTAFEYSDCWVDDARMVVLALLDAQRMGAHIRPRTEVVAARRDGALWRVTLAGPDGARQEVAARGLVNAAGPWVDRVIAGVFGSNTPPRVRLVKGSHIIVRKFWDGPHAYLLQNDDKRVIFVCPYLGDLCMIGTTDVAFTGNADAVKIDVAERDYLLRAVNRYMRAPLSPQDVVDDYAGVRPLYDDKAGNPSAITRDYVLDVQDSDGAAPLLTVFGGKLTTFRKLAEHAMAKLGRYYPRMKGDWTATACLPGGDMPGADFDTFAASMARRYDFLPPELARCYARTYGTRILHLLDGAQGFSDLGHCFGGLLYEREAEFLIRHEWAHTPDDVLMRRTKHGLHMTEAERERFGRWMTGG